MMKLIWSRKIFRIDEVSKRMRDSGALQVMIARFVPFGSAREPILPLAYPVTADPVDSAWPA